MVIMILASAMRHSVGRPATGMGGGKPMERPCQPPSGPLFTLESEIEIRIGVHLCPKRILSYCKISPNLGRIMEVFQWQAIPT